MVNIIIIHQYFKDSIYSRNIFQYIHGQTGKPNSKTPSTMFESAKMIFFATIETNTVIKVFKINHY